MGDLLWIDVSSTTGSSIDSSSITTSQEIFQLPLWRHELDMVFLYTVFYVAVFSVGFFGNVFVVLAVVIHPSLRSTTDWLISSLATADLLIMLFCLPATLLNNILTEWQLGSFACKLSVWVNATTSCASIFTLVAVTADRYMAICHTLKYTQWDTKYTLYIIAGIWIVSGSMASPQIYNYDTVKFDYLTEDNRLAHIWLCSSTSDERIQFLVVNLLLGFIAPFILIFVFYTMIFIRVSNHRSLAVDAHIRDERVKLRVAHMMLTVIAFFALCWVPLYSIYFYFLFISDGDSEFMRVASTILRPFFQWLSLLSSSLNPVIYIAYSLKYRRAFHRLLLLPCRNRYERVRTLTRTTLRLGSSPQTIKKRPPNYLSTTLPTEQTTLTRASNRSLNNFRSPSGSPSLVDGRESRESDFRFSSCKKITQF